MAVHMMTELIKHYPNAVLLIAGNGSGKSNLEDLIAELRLQDNVKLLGYVTNLQDYQHITDIDVSCSKREGLPLNIVEAMLSGTPVVATNNRGHRELITDGKNGYLVNIGDISSMKEKVLSLLNNPRIYNSISDNEVIRGNEYSATSVIKELEKVYFDELK